MHEKKIILLVNLTETTIRVLLKRKFLSQLSFISCYRTTQAWSPGRQEIQCRSGTSGLSSRESFTAISCCFLLLPLCGPGFLSTARKHSQLLLDLRAVNLFNSCKCSGVAGAFFLLPGDTFTFLPSPAFLLQFPLSILLGTDAVSELMEGTVWYQPPKLLPYIGLLRYFVHQWLCCHPLLTNEDHCARIT